MLDLLESRAGDLHVDGWTKAAEFMLSLADYRRTLKIVISEVYCSVLSLVGKVNTRRMSQPNMESNFYKNNL